MEENKVIENSQNEKPAKKLNKFKIIVPFYNCYQYLENCLNSILTQDYDGDFEVLFIDDFSTDSSYTLIPRCDYEVDEQGNFVKDENGDPVIKYKHPLLEITKCKNILLWRSATRQTALPNIHNAIMNFCDDNDSVTMLVDGDDMLIGKNVLTHFNDLYNDTDAWLIYGKSRWTNGMPCCSSAYSEEEFKDVRKAPFRISHLRTFRTGLYKAIGLQDLNYDCLKDKSGEYFLSGYDTAMFYPIMDIVPFEKVHYNTKIVYLYNRENVLNDDKQNQQLQWDVHREVLNKKPFKKIKDYRTGELA